VTGKVYLVGAGPGNLDYLTLKAKKLIESAEVLIYDALVEERLLNLVPAECLKLNVSKRGGQKSTPQAQINQMLIAYCLQGKRVVRLKSGDPSIFGRATEEIQALNEAGCFWEIVPGISSALAAPLLEGIPLTDRLLSNAFAVFSAHDPAILNWDALTQLDTLVILMGGNSLKEIIRQLLQRGRDVRENIAIVRNCSRRDRQVWQGTLKDILETVGDRSLSPAVIIIGKVVELGQQLNPRPINTLPLSGKTILVTRAADRSSQFTELLEEQGAEVIEMPALEIRPPSSWHDLDFAIENLSTFTWLILTSANGVDYFFSRLQALG
jgi:uroporphyrinogen III methyltransferase/synthase